MKTKILLLLVMALFSGQMMAQTNIWVPTNDGYIHGNGTFYANNLYELKYDPTGSFARVAYIEFPVNEIVAANSVKLEMEYYYSNKDFDVTLIVDIMEGQLPSDITWVNQPDSKGFTFIDSTTYNKKNYGLKSFDITSFYNSALSNNATHVLIRIHSAGTDALLRFRSSREAGKGPRLNVETNCKFHTLVYDTIVCEGSTMMVGDLSVTESGTYIDSLTSSCGADSVGIYNVLIIKDGTINLDTTICAESSLDIVSGVGTYKTISESGLDTIIITNGTCTQTTIVSLSFYDLPVANNLGLDTEIKEAESLVLDAGAGFVAYQWYNNGKVIAGETAQTFTVNKEKVGIEFGINEINVEVIDGNGCVGSAPQDIWVEITGNFINPIEDMHLYEQDGLIKATATLIDLKNDTWGDQALNEPAPPYWGREIYLAFDLTGLPEEAKNYKLKLYVNSLATNPKQPTPDTTMVVDVEYVDGKWADNLTWATKEDISRTKLGTSTKITPADVKNFVEWDINNVLTELIGKKDIISVILSTNDQYSMICRFNSIENSEKDTWPALTYEIEGVTSTVSPRVLTLLDIYPNPVKDILNLRNAEDYISVSIYDITGKKLVSKQNEVNHIDVSALKSGVYIIRFENNMKITSKRFIKQ